MADKDPRERLRKLAAQLRELQHPDTVDADADGWVELRLVDAASWAADAIDRFLNGEEPSLDAAFGVAPRRGVKGNPLARWRLALKVEAMRRAGKSWKQIGDTLDYDVRELQRIRDRFDVDLISLELGRRLKRRGVK